MGKSQQKANLKAIRHAVGIVILSIAILGCWTLVFDRLTASPKPVTKSEIQRPIQTRVVKLPVRAEAENLILDKRITEMFDANAQVKFPMGIEKLKTLFVAL